MTAYIVAIQITVLGMTGTALPPQERHRVAFDDAAACHSFVKRERARILASLPTTPDAIECVTIPLRARPTP